MRTSASLDTTQPRWIVVVQPSRPATLTSLRRTFHRSPWVEVLVDRRHGERRQADQPHETERRVGDRRRREDDRTRTPNYRLAHRGEGHDVFEANSPAGAQCPDCAMTVWFEMPRFVEPPARLEVDVVHEKGAPNRPRHFVELQSFTSTGRPILASRVAGQAMRESA